MLNLQLSLLGSPAVWRFFQVNQVYRATLLGITRPTSGIVRLEPTFNVCRPASVEGFIGTLDNIYKDCPPPTADRRLLSLDNCQLAINY